jgi:hypothetical protein
MMATAAKFAVYTLVLWALLSSIDPRDMEQHSPAPAHLTTAVHARSVLRLPRHQLRQLDMLADRAIAAVALLFRALGQPDVDPIDVVVAWVAVELEATPHVDAQLAMALMWPESRYQATAGPACGVMQVYPHDIGLDDRSSCALWRRDVRAGVHAGVVEIEMLLADRRVHNLREALLYRACGNKAFTGECDMGVWVDRVLTRRAYMTDGSIKLAHQRPAT